MGTAVHCINQDEMALFIIAIDVLVPGIPLPVKVREPSLLPLIQPRSLSLLIARSLVIFVSLDCSLARHRADLGNHQAGGAFGVLPRSLERNHGRTDQRGL
jgi:hypothetical protein